MNEVQSMMCYKCDCCGDVSESLGDRIDIKFTNAGVSWIKLVNGGEYQVCIKCYEKIIKSFNRLGGNNNE